MSIVWGILISSSLFAANDVQKSFVESHQCLDAMNAQFHQQYFAERSNKARQIVRFRDDSRIFHEYALWDKENNKLNHVKYIETPGDTPTFWRLQIDAPKKEHNQYVLRHTAHLDMPSVHDWAGCPVSFSPKTGIRNDSVWVPPAKITYEDCADKMGLAERSADSLNIDRQISNLLEAAVVEQLKSTSVKDLKPYKELAPKARLKIQSDTRQLARILPKIKKACMAVGSKKIRAAFADYLQLIYQEFPNLKPRTKSGKKKSSGAK